MEAAWNIKKWLSLDLYKIFDPTEITRYWETDSTRNVHPSGVKWFYIIAQKVIFWENNPYRQNAILNVFIFSISLLVFLIWWSKGSLQRCIIPIILLLTIPRFFAHAHFPATDIPMTSILMLFVVCLDWSLFKKSFWLSGVILGFFISIKITALLLAFPVLLLFLLWYRFDWKVVIPRILLICVIGLFIFYLLNPDYWFSPIARFKEFIVQSSTRRSWTPFTVYFNGQFFSYRGPWHYPLTIFFITTPVLHILFLFVGLVLFAIKQALRKDLKIMLIFICLTFPFLILALPISPAHDGIRYLLPAFPFAACFMAMGLEKLWNSVKDQSNTYTPRKIFKWIAATAALLLFAGDLLSPARYPPFELSYYNRIVGGISGAFKRGYETTYWWEIINDDVLEQLNKRCKDSYVYFPISPTDYYFKHMIDANKIAFKPTQDIDRADFMLIYGRPYVNFWEIHTLQAFKQAGKIPINRWGISLDSVPLIQLYSMRYREIK